MARLLPSPKSDNDLFERAARLHRAGNLEHAKQAYSDLLERDPAHTNALGNLGSLLSSERKYPEAIAILKRAIKLAPKEPAHLYNLGNVYRAQHNLTNAISAYVAAIALSPQFANAHYNLGITYNELNQRADAEHAYRKAIATDPRHYDALLDLGNVLMIEGRLTESMGCFTKAAALNPMRAAAYNNLAHAYAAAGRFDESIAASQTALKLEPGRHSIASNILFTMQYVARYDDIALLSTAKSFGERFPATQTVSRPRLNGRPLRVGYVSGDFYNHTVGLLLSGILQHHSPARVTAYCYSTGARVDNVTQDLAANAQWRNIADASDEAVLAQIRDDAIDVLVDLAGHTSGNRLPLFAKRAAPLQVSWLGYFATTGVREIDAVLMDEYHVPRGHEILFTEPLWRLPNIRFTYTHVSFAPHAVPPAPTFANGWFTFGSFNNSAKLNDHVIEVWSQILRAVPTSRLILKWRTFNDPVTCQWFRQKFIDQGIDPNRLELRRHTPHQNLLEEYADIDIGLDPFPFTGGLTSLESLWMGVPVITLPGTRPVSRQTYAYLANIGLTDELVATSEADYIHKAVTWASDQTRLAEFRAKIRSRMEASPLIDGSAMARNLENAYLALWYGADDNLYQSGTVADWFNSESVAVWQHGNHDRARDLMRAAITANPNITSFHCNLAMMLKGVGTPKERADHYRRALELDPTASVVYGNLAAVLNEMQDLVGAETIARQGLRNTPERAETWMNLGCALQNQKRYAEAADAFEAALRLSPNLVQALNAAGQAYRLAGNWQSAIPRLRQAVEILTSLPSDQRPFSRAATLHSLGELLAECKQPINAEICFREALSEVPDDLAIQTDLGNALMAQGRFDEAYVSYQAIVENAVHLPGAHINLGTLYQTLGRHDEAIVCYRKALMLDPTIQQAYGNLGASLTYSVIAGPSELKAMYVAFDQHVAKPLRDERPFANTQDPDRKIRIGYVSPDFRRHAVAYFALPLLKGHHSNKHFDVVCYYNHRQNDEWTQTFKSIASEWVDCVEMDDATLAQRIRDDRIDILVDLAGHTEGGRLLVFARKPAPIQVTWMGYVTTTGLSAMDYRITHSDADPAGVESHYSEILIRIPGTMWCYRPLPNMPEVSSAPVTRNGFVTFGSFNRFSKVGRRVQVCWMQILSAVPNSRLLICIPEGDVRTEFVARFQTAGIAPERLNFFTQVSHEQFWALHAEVDIALDPFPFGGGTTTCETLWMGVPLITCTGGKDSFEPRFASRMGGTFLKLVGLGGLVTTTESEYVQFAVELANDPTRIATLRSELRLRMANSPLTDEPRFVGEVENAYRCIWRTRNGHLE